MNVQSSDSVNNSVLLSILSNHIFNVIHYLISIDNLTLLDNQLNIEDATKESISISLNDKLIRQNYQILTEPFKLLLIGKYEHTSALKTLILELILNTYAAFISDDNKYQNAFSDYSKTNTNVQKTLLDKTQSLINIDNFTIERFLKLDYKQRYDLGIVFDPQIVMKKNAQASEMTQAHVSNLNNVAIRLRDLFSHQSILYVDKYVKTKSFNLVGLGYAQSTLLQFNNTKNITSHELLSAPTATKIICQSDTLENSRPLGLDDNNNVLQQFECWQFNLYDYKPKPDWLNAKYWANPENFDKFRW